MKVNPWMQRFNNSKLRYGIEELKYLRSCEDLKYFYEKIQYLMPRTIGKNDISSKVPPSLQIEPTNICNLRCICCSTSRGKRTRGYMDFSLYQKIIDEAKQLGVRHIHLYLHGEPLLHPRIINMIAYTKVNGLAVHLTTNGLLLNEERIERILQSGITFADIITFSILGFSKEVVERVMKWSNYDKVQKNLFDFVRLRQKYRKHGPIIEVRLYKLPENDLEEKQFIEYWKNKVDHVIVVGKISQSFAQYKLSEIRTTRTHTCSVLWERMTIFWNGDVCLCCQDVDGDFILGNLRENSIQEVWHNQQLLAIKKLHLGKKFHEFPFCDRCDL
jgi:radical SAM protein with 4Fe4S-binding SPASM domain